MQAVSRKAEGIEPRDCDNPGRATLFKWRKPTWVQLHLAGCMRFPGVGDHGMYDTWKVRQPGRPCFRFPGRGEGLWQPKQGSGGPSEAGSRMVS